MYRRRNYGVYLGRNIRGDLGRRRLAPGGDAFRGRVGHDPGERAVLDTHVVVGGAGFSRVYCVVDRGWRFAMRPTRVCFVCEVDTPSNMGRTQANTIPRTTVGSVKAVKSTPLLVVDNGTGPKSL